MKKTIKISIFAALILSFGGCILRESASGRTGSSSLTVNDVLSAGMAEGKQAENGEAEEAKSGDAAVPVSAEPAASGQVDVDLTKMSATMVYSEVYNMLAVPDDYIGKTVRMSGKFQIYEGEGRNYYVVIIPDATACCQQGMEFILADPDAYPEPGRDVTVTGVFDTYYEGESMRFCQLIDATVTN